MNRSYRAHLHTVAYLGLGAACLVAGWTLPAAAWWQQWGLEPNVWWNAGALAAMAVAMVLKVHRPTLALLLGGGCVLVDLSFGVSLGILFCLTDLIYNHGVRAEPPRARAAEIALPTIAVGSTVLLTLVVGSDDFLNILLIAVAILLVPLWWAVEVRRGYPAFVEDRIRHRLTEERNASLLAEQRRRRRQALETERQHMARELHDVVSSQVASIALTSGAVLNSEPDTERDRAALKTIRTTSVEALEELRQMVQVLRSADADEHGETSPVAADITWDQLLSRAENQGLDVSVTGQLPEQVPRSLQTVILRILQESLTNAAKYGDGTAQVELRQQTENLILTVDSGLSVQGNPEVEALSGGSGLIAMTERAQAVGGCLEAGERQESWRVRGILPYQEVSS